MIKILFTPLFISCLILFALHQISQKALEISFPFIDSYLDDIVIMPIILRLILIERRFLLGMSLKYQYSVLDYILITLVVGVIAEWVFPLFSNKFTFDWYDFLAYGFGTLVYVFFNSVGTPKIRGQDLH